MSSTYNDVRAAIEGRIANEMANAPSYPVSYQNVPFTPPNDNHWIQVFVRFGNNSYATLLPTGGTGYNLQTGTLVINVFTLNGQGTAVNFTIAERLKDLFDRLVLESIIFDAASGPSVISANIVETGVSASSGLSAVFLQTQLSITFQAYLD